MSSKKQQQKEKQQQQEQSSSQDNSNTKLSLEPVPCMRFNRTPVIRRLGSSSLPQVTTHQRSYNSASDPKKYSSLFSRCPMTLADSLDIADKLATQAGISTSAIPKPQMVNRPPQHEDSHLYWITGGGCGNETGRPIQPIVKTRNNYMKVCPIEISNSHHVIMKEAHPTAPPDEVVVEGGPEALLAGSSKCPMRFVQSCADARKESSSPSQTEFIPFEYVNSAQVNGDLSDGEAVEFVAQAEQREQLKIEQQAEQKEQEKKKKKILQAIAEHNKNNNSSTSSSSGSSSIKNKNNNSSSNSNSKVIVHQKFEGRSVQSLINDGSLPDDIPVIEYELTDKETAGVLNTAVD